MAEEIAFENGRISNFEGFTTLTLTLTRVILHTVVHHSSTSTYTPNFTKIKEMFCGQTDRRTDGKMHGQTCETGFIRSTLSKSRPKKQQQRVGATYTPVNIQCDSAAGPLGWCSISNTIMDTRRPDTWSTSSTKHRSHTDVDWSGCWLYDRLEKPSSSLQEICNYNRLHLTIIFWLRSVDTLMPKANFHNILLTEQQTENAIMVQPLFIHYVLASQTAVKKCIRVCSQA